MNKKNKRDAVIVGYGRTPMSRANKGYLANIHPVDYASQVIKGILDKLPQLSWESIDDVIVGSAMPEKYMGFNIGRLIAQRAGLPDSVPGQTVNRFCSSGLQAIETAANAIRANEMDIVIAGGVERMTDISMTHPEEYWDMTLSEKNSGTYMPMGITAENIAEKFNISRIEMESIAVESHRKAAEAQTAGKFNDEIIPVVIEYEGKKKTYTQDEGIRANTSMEELAKLKPCFKKDGFLTAGTSSQMTDGAAFILIMARETAEKLGLRIIAKCLTFAVAGVSAEIMGIGPIVAVPKVLEKTELSIADIDVIEMNEAFASQLIYCIESLKLPKRKVNPNGGAMSLGHPLGATGAFLTCKILSELKRTNGKYGLVTMCIGGGMGAAGIYQME